MGEEIAKTSFAPEDTAEFERRLAAETQLLGQEVKKGQVLLILESMKMQNQLKSPRSKPAAGLPN